MEGQEVRCGGLCRSGAGCPGSLLLLEFPVRDQARIWHDAMDLKNKILSKKAEIGVVGLGYVGLSLSMELVRSGFRVHGIDIDGEKVEQMNRGESSVQDVAGPILKAAVDSDQFRAYQDYEVVSRVDCVIICVPTPLRQTKDPDISYIVDATREIRRYLHNDMLIILESTSYPGTTEEVLLNRSLCNSVESTSSVVPG